MRDKSQIITICQNGSVTVLDKDCNICWFRCWCWW